jgi:hypothetical protein
MLSSSASARVILRVAILHFLPIDHKLQLPRAGFARSGFDCRRSVDELSKLQVASGERHHLVLN